MTSQRFCLRWNNHQSNLLSVFDQLLHAETFTDVTLAVEGQYLKAHKMVLSACSPYFNALFVNHPEKHPIVILKDVPYADMKSLLDFMYRGEVSVDQERLTAFLRVAESLRIKGLTEVNDEKPLGPAITPPPPQLHRIQPYLVQQRKAQGMLMNSPLLGSALSMPKRKRGRPRKLSGSSNGTGNDFDDYDRENLVQGSPEMLEVKMGADGYSGNEGSDDNQRESENNEQEHDSNQVPMDTSETANSKTQSKEATSGKDNDNSVSEHMNNSPELTQRLLGFKPDSDSTQSNMHQKIKVNPSTQSPHNSSNSLLQQQLQNDSLNNNHPSPNASIVLSSQTTVEHSTTSSANSLQHPYLMQMTNTATTSASSPSDFYKNSPTRNTASCGNDVVEGGGGGEGGGNSIIDPMSPTLGGMAKPPQRRRIRRKATSSPDDQAEHLTEMSVRGLDLFRYASITEGVYQCTECAKENVQKTFKNKYSFQRHAFLYHEGKHRKVFPCPVCGKEFSRPDKMKNHMKTTHECYIPKEVNYHPLNYLITAAAAGEIQQIFPQLDSNSSTTGAATPTSTVSPIKIDKLPLKSENSFIKSEPPPTPATDSSISLKEADEVK